jgi:acyl-coenzyme A synthetase/AMP-(fatty) acid ligase
LFAAAMLENYVTVMPANQSEGELARLKQANPEIRVMSDEDVLPICQLRQFKTDALLSREVLLELPQDRLVAELYTSGSTGTPVANHKRWGELVHGARRVAARFDLNRDAQHVVVATVPPQHMFGFEMSVVLPLVCGIAVHHGKPFYPEDIQYALQAVPEKRMLVTTPVHLKACVTVKVDWPKIDFILSSTATLPKDVAETATAVMQAPVREIYGCSEIGAIATRTLIENDSWEVLGDFRLDSDGDAARLTSSILYVPLQLSDRVAVDTDGRFRLVGRAADMVKIGGKRGSLNEITLRIKAIPGVDDAIVFLPPRKEHKRERLAALVVAPGLSAKEIRQQVGHAIDPVFLPRQIYLVAKLPYTATGKLPKAELVAMLEENQKKAKAC